MEQHVILVDHADNPIGTMEKLQAHRDGRLHRAFSVFLFNVEGEVLLQRRATGKYHSANLWTNTCCSHPCPGEAVDQAAQRRLMEEMGIDCPSSEVFVFTYQAQFDNGLSEHEVDHVLVGYHDGDPQPNPAEVSDWRWLSLPALTIAMERVPSDFTPWLHRIMAEHLVTLQNLAIAPRRALPLDA